MCFYVCVYVCLSVGGNVCFSFSLCMSVGLYMSLSQCVCVSLSMCVSVSVYVYVSQRVCLCVSVCVCLSGEGAEISRNWATAHFLAFDGLRWNGPGISGCVV